MPVYLYECENHKEIELEHSMKESIELCPLCKKDNKEIKLKRLIAGGTNFVLNGGGWASEGYK
jgi:predicted nucleic acid-binding Zn ribbon protein